MTPLQHIDYVIHTFWLGYSSTKAQSNNPCQAGPDRLITMGILADVIIINFMKKNELIIQFLSEVGGYLILVYKRNKT